MIGYHAVSVIADAYLKGIRGYDADKALEAMIRSSNINKKGSDYYTAPTRRSPAGRSCPG